MRGKRVYSHYCNHAALWRKLLNQHSLEALQPLFRNLQWGEHHWSRQTIYLLNSHSCQEIPFLILNPNQFAFDSSIVSFNRKWSIPSCTEQVLGGCNQVINLTFDFVCPASLTTPYGTWFLDYYQLSKSPLNLLQMLYKEFHGKQNTIQSHSCCRHWLRHLWIERTSLLLGGCPWWLLSCPSQGAGVDDGSSFHHAAAFRSQTWAC